MKPAQLLPSLGEFPICGFCGIDNVPLHFPLYIAALFWLGKSHFYSSVLVCHQNLNLWRTRKNKGSRLLICNDTTTSFMSFSRQNVERSVLDCLT